MRCKDIPRKCELFRIEFILNKRKISFIGEVSLETDLKHLLNVINMRLKRFLKDL